MTVRRRGELLTQTGLLSTGPGRIPSGWTLKSKPGWTLEHGPLPAPAVGYGITVQEVGTSRPYLRQTFPFTLTAAAAALHVQVRGRATGAETVDVVLGLSATQDVADLTHRWNLALPAGLPGTAVVDVRDLPRGDYLGLLQINVPRAPGAQLELLEVSVAARDESLPPLRIHFSTFGDRLKASSRLRAWRIGDQLAEMGHTVAYNQPDPFVEPYDVYVFQKVMPFKLSKELNRTEAVVVYDYDDHFGGGDHGSLGDLVDFIDLADMCTTGSEHLARFTRDFHPRVEVLENPADIGSHAGVRTPTADLQQVGWFGAPEGLRQLDQVRLSRRVTTVTRGGDVEFELATVDDVLRRFDLLLFPLEPTDWNLAKNANRMIKALALGVPVLCSDTPEHSRVAEQVGLSDLCLVAEGDDWDAAVDRLANKFEEVQRRTLEARDRALHLYSLEAVTERWLDLVRAAPTRRLKGRPTRRAARQWAPAQDLCVLVLDEGRRDLASTLGDSELRWGAFGQALLVTTSGRQDNLLTSSGFSCDLAPDPVSYYRHVDAALDRVEAEHVLLLPSGYVVKHALAAALRQHSDLPVDLTLLGSNPLAGRRDTVPGSIFDLPDLFAAPQSPGPLLARTAWLRQGLPARETLGFWTWSSVVRALVEQAGYRVSGHSCSVRLGARQVPNLSGAHLAWLRANRPEAVKDFPNPTQQWRRASADVLTRVARTLGPWQAPVLGHLVATSLAARETDARTAKGATA